MLLSDNVTYQFVLSSVVNKHILLALIVLYFCGFYNGIRARVHDPSCLSYFDPRTSW